MKIVAVGSSITSSYWNGAATYYRGIYRGLARLGHEIVFAEPNVYGRQQHRDGDDAEFSYVRSLIYDSPRDLDRIVEVASNADLFIKHSGVGADDEFLEAAAASLRSGTRRVAFWDVDAPATLARVEMNDHDPFRALIPQFDLIFTYGGGRPVVDHYLRLGARNCHPVYNGLDPDQHHAAAPVARLSCDLVFIANRLPDREKRVDDFFFRAAERAPEMSFVLGGEGWGGKRLSANVRWIGHVSTRELNQVNCSARMVLNINRESMAEVGFSPPTRVFEAAGSASCLITDAWNGIKDFFEPDKEILVAHSAEDVVSYLRHIDGIRAQALGKSMRARALRDHTYARRARQVDHVLSTTAARVAA